MRRLRRAWRKARGDLRAALRLRRPGGRQPAAGRTFAGDSPPPRIVPAPRPWTARRAVLSAAAVPLLAGCLLVDHVAYDRRGLPDLEPFLQFEPPTIGQIFDAHGEVLIEVAREYRTIVRYDELPPILRQAILAAEDKNFFEHHGVDYAAWPRVVFKSALRSCEATIRALRSRRRPAVVVVFPQGGSTITQQLVRTYFLPDVTRREAGPRLVEDTPATRLAALVVGRTNANKLVRKVREIRLALWLEDEMARRLGSRRAAKEEILARYASFVYLGDGRYGFAAASNLYFGLPLEAYTDAEAGEAATLAGIVKSPGEYAPVGAAAIERTRRRRDAILDLMVEAGYLTPEAARAHQQAEVRVAARQRIKTTAPAVVEAVFEELGRSGSERPDALFDGRIQIYATVDAHIQAIASEALERGLEAFESRHPEARGLIQGSVVILANRDAGILAEVGGRNVFKDRQTRYTDYNRATESRRQPGSALKPLVYLAALEQGSGLDTEVPDLPISVNMGVNRPRKWIANYDYTFKGLLPMRQALAESRNAATVWMARTLGIGRVLEAGRALGFESLEPYISTALGASVVNLLELTNAYRALASGVVARPHIIREMTDASGRALVAPAPELRPLPVSGRSLRLIQEGLRGVVRLPGGTARALDNPAFGIPVMGKTGTTNGHRDALFVGSTYGLEGITVGVRLGYDDYRELGRRETGARAALPIFRDIVHRIYAQGLAGPVPRFPADLERNIDDFIFYYHSGRQVEEESPGDGEKTTVDAQGRVASGEPAPASEGAPAAAEAHPQAPAIGPALGPAVSVPAGPDRPPSGPSGDPRTPPAGSDG